MFAQNLPLRDSPVCGGVRLNNFNWPPWAPIITGVLTLLITSLGVIMQRKQVALAEAQLLAANKKKAVPKTVWWRQYWPTVLMLLLAASVWIPYLYFPFPPVGGAMSSLVWQWGVMNPIGYGSGAGDIVINGHLLQKYKDSHKIAAVALHNFGQSDNRDVEALQTKWTLRYSGWNDYGPYSLGRQICGRS